MKDPRRDHDADRIRVLLEKVTPGDPGVGQRAATVARRARRQRARAGVLGGVGIAAAAAAVLITPTFLSTSPTTNDTSDPARTSEGPNPLTTTPCPAGPQQKVDELGRPAIGTDAVSVRLCVGRELDPVGNSWRPPADALVQTDGFLADVAAMQAPDPRRCDALRPIADPVLLVVGYPDGEIEYAATSADLCSDIDVGGTRSASAVVAAFTDALAAQRSKLAPNGPVEADIDCSPSLDAAAAAPWREPIPLTRGPVPDESTSFTRLVLCGSNGLEESTAEAIAALNAAWAGSIRDLSVEDPLDVDRCPFADVNFAPAYLISTFGDVLKVQGVACGNYRAHGFQGGQVQFLPDAETRRILSLS